MAQSLEEIKSRIERLKEDATAVKNQLDQEETRQQSREIERGAIDSRIDSYTGDLSHKAFNHMKELKTAQDENNILCEESDERVGQLETELSLLEHEIWALEKKIEAEQNRMKLQKDIVNAFD